MERTTPATSEGPRWILRSVSPARFAPLRRRRQLVKEPIKKSALVGALFAAWFFGTSAVAVAGDALLKQWLCDAEESAAIRTAGVEVQQAAWHLIAVTTFYSAAAYLKDNESVALDADQARFFVGHEWPVSEGYKPFLVRGVFANATGQHQLFLRGGDLLVQHSSLGTSEPSPEFSPLVVNLRTPPSRVCNFLHVTE